jgi:hypothetical protein
MRCVRSPLFPSLLSLTFPLTQQQDLTVPSPVLIDQAHSGDIELSTFFEDAEAIVLELVKNEFAGQERDELLESLDNIKTGKFLTPENHA